MADTSNMICPACQTFQVKAEICNKCGVVIAKTLNPGRTEVKKAAAPIKRKSSLPRPLMVLVIGIPVIAYFLFTGSGTDEGPGGSGDKASANAGESTGKRKIDPVDRIAVVNPAAAANIRRNNVRAKLAMLRPMLYMNGMDGGEPPSNEQGLRLLVDQGQLTLNDITDDWGNPFVYRLQWGKETPWGKEDEIFVHSKGPDGVSGNGDDIALQ